MAIVSARSLMAARTHAAVDGISTSGMMFAERHMLDPEFGNRVPPICSRLPSSKKAGGLIDGIERGAGKRTESRDRRTFVRAG